MPMTRLLLLTITLLAATACSKPTELASNKNAKGSITVAAAAPNTPPPAIPAEELAAIAAEQGEAAPVDPNAIPVDSTSPSGPATVTDYRSSVSGEIGALPPVGDAAALAAAFVDWRGKAAAAPGAFEAGQQQLGADEQEYSPSDAELVAAEAGDRLSAALQGADEATRTAVANAVGSSTSYRRFDFRRVDVAGSGRFVYASAPREASLPL
jgi:hypothetical protein